LRVIKDNEIVSDSWELLDNIDAEKGPPPGNVIVPFSYWTSHREELLEREGSLGVCVAGDDDTEAVAADLDHFDLVAVDFPEFRDGRGYSHARILREHHDYRGDIRAVGEVLRDQLYFMKRCGISSFQLPADRDGDEALRGFAEFSVTYQTAADGAPPVYRQR